MEVLSVAHVRMVYTLDPSGVRNGLGIRGPG